MAEPNKCTRCGAALSPTGEMCTSCGSIVQQGLSDGLKAGTMIAGRYEVIEQVGAGGMGRVYRAIQQPLGTVVCIKTLHTGGTADPQFATRFEREARTTSQLRHPNIVSVFDFGTQSDGSLFLAMEYVDGENLAKVLKQGDRMSAKRAVHILGQVCAGLQFAHSRGVIHRDLKPANIMIIQLPSDPDHAKVLDFGSAVILEGEEGDRLTRVGTVIGTPAYMAPEYILGRGLDARVDVYAVGTLLYTLLCGGPPFRGNAQAVFAQQVSVPPMPPRKRNPQADISAAMESVIMRALVKDPAKRFASAAELREAMENALRGEAVAGVEIEVAAGAVAEIATQERPVVVVSADALGGLTPKLIERIRSVGSARGAIAVGDETSGARLIFGLDKEGSVAAAEAMRCAMELTSLNSVRPLKVGIRDAQVSCKGVPGQPGFSFELFGKGAETADRLAAHAQPGSVVIAGPVARHTPAELRMMPVRPPKELDEPAFVLTDPLRNTASLDDLPFAGRSVEQRKLLEVAANAKHGIIAVVQGPMGSGKTRLVDEVLAQAARVGVVWCVAAASADPEIGPSHAVSVLAALGWSAPGQGASATERYVVDAMLGRLEETADGLSGERKQLRLVSSALDGIARRLEQDSVVVVFDQLEAADDLTWALAKRVVDVAATLKLSVVLCVRDIAEIPFPLPTDTRKIPLEPLTDKEVESLATAAGIARNQASLVRVTRGIPLLAREVFRTASLGDVDALATIGDLDASAAVARLVGLRIAHLGKDAIELLEASAVLGVSPVAGEARALCGNPSNHVERLAELQAAALLYADPSGKLRFPFPLARDVALAAVPADRRQSLHRRAADLVASSPTAAWRRGEIGEHLLAAGEREKAFSALDAAADFCRAEGAMGQAIRYYRLATDAGDALGDRKGAERGLVSKKLSELLIQSGRLPDAEKILRWSFPKARALNAPELAADLLRLHGRVLALQGHPEDGRGEIEAALKFAESKGFPTVAAEACGDLADVADAKGDRTLAAETLRRGLALIEAREDRAAATVRIQLYNRLGRLELLHDNLAGAIALFTQALSLAERSQDRYQSAGLLGNLGGAYAKRGEMNRAIHFTERALRASETLGDQIGVARQSHNLALLRLANGQSGVARQLLRTSFDASRRAGWRQGLEMSTAALGRLDA